MSQVIVERREPNIAVRALWFVFLGWWLTGLLSAVAWFINLTIIGLPLGLWIINRLPTIATLKTRDRAIEITIDEATGTTTVRTIDVEQRSLWLRALYFFLVGWWFSGLWMMAAWIFVVLFVTLPLAFWMYGAIGKVTTLAR